MRITLVYRPYLIAMYVCVCNAVTDREIRQCADLGVKTLDQLRECLGVASCCGKCEGTARAVLHEREHGATARASGL